MQKHLGRERVRKMTNKRTRHKYLCPPTPSFSSWPSQGWRKSAVGISVESDGGSKQEPQNSWTGRTAFIKVWTAIYLQTKTGLKHLHTKGWRLLSTWDCGSLIPTSTTPAFSPTPRSQGETLAAHSHPACSMPSTWPTANPLHHQGLHMPTLTLQLSQHSQCIQPSAYAPGEHLHSHHVPCVCGCLA